MANVRAANTYFVDTASSGGPPSTSNALIVDNIILVGIQVRATAAGAIVELADNSSSQPVKWIDGLATQNDTKFTDLSDTPIRFPNGIAITTLTNAECVLIVREGNGG